MEKFRLTHSLKIHIQIANTGQLSEEELKKATGFGIQNTKHRLNLLYGEKGSFKIENASEGEVFAEVIIPTGGKINESFNSR